MFQNLNKIRILTLFFCLMLLFILVELRPKLIILNLTRFDSQPASNLSKKISANSFDINIKKIFEYKFLTTYLKIKDSRLFILPENVEDNESIIGFQMVKFPQEIYTHQGRTLHRVFEFNNRLIGVGWLRSKINNIDCLRIGLFDAYEGRIVFDGDCIEGSIEKIETKEGGGAILVDKSGFYLGIGAPDIDNDFISSWFDVKNGRFDKGYNRLLAQLDNSIYGKILFFTEIQTVNGYRLTAKVAAKGIRNPQGIVRLNNGTILFSDHGSKGGDKINKFKYGANYGWPLTSLGDSYTGISFPAASRFNVTLESAIYNFIPSIAPSNLRECPKIVASRYSDFYCILASTLRDESIWIILYDDIFERVISTERIHLGYRIRQFENLEEGRPISDNSLIFSTDGDGIFELVFHKNFQ